MTIMSYFVLLRFAIEAVPHACPNRTTLLVRIAKKLCLLIPHLIKYISIGARWFIEKKFVYRLLIADM